MRATRMRDLTRIFRVLRLLAFCWPWAGGMKAVAENLVPARPGKAPNYCCTWSAQNYMYGIGSPGFDPKELEGDRGANHARAAMNESNVFGAAGWVTTFFPKVRGDLYVVFDDGLFRDGLGSFQIDEKKFPFLAGLDPAERVRKLNDRTRAAGWRGAALWCGAPQNSGEAATNFVLWSKQGGIEYWKIDGGDDNFTFIDIAKSLYPALKLEHIAGAGPFNTGDGGRFHKYKADSHEVQCLEHSDVFRTYDVSAALSLPTALDRVAAALRWGNEHKVRALINCEDEVYLAATLGCTMGVMRHPLVGLRSGLGLDDLDPGFTCPRQCKRRLDEVVRALHWQRIAPPFARFRDEPHPEDATRIDEKILADVWTFKPGEMWWSEAIGKPFGQCAPARVSRGLPLPAVASEGEPPFVVAGRFPNGAVAVATQGRTLEGKNWFFSPTDVTVQLGSASGPIGIFGRYRSLTLQYAAPLGEVRISAQDLAGEQAEDITSQAIIRGNTLILSGTLIDKVGLRAATPGDLSDPGLVLVIRK
jgi:hypothetical protein